MSILRIHGEYPGYVAPASGRLMGVGGEILSSTTELTATATSTYNNVYYVSTSGDDNNSGTSTISPWRTITKAAHTMVGGDIVYIRGGTYSETTSGASWTTPHIVPSNSGSAGGHINFHNYPGEDAVLLATGSHNAYALIGSLSRTYLKFDGLILDGNNITPQRLMRLDSAHNTVVRNCLFRNSGASGDAFQNTVNFCNDITVENNEFANMLPSGTDNSAAMHTYSCQRFTFRYNYVHDSAYGLYLKSHVADALVYRNYFKNIDGNVFYVFQNSGSYWDRNDIYENLIVGGRPMYFPRGSDNDIEPQLRFYNNTCADLGAYGWYVAFGSSPTPRYHHYWNNIAAFNLQGSVGRRATYDSSGTPSNYRSYWDYNCYWDTATYYFFANNVDRTFSQWVSATGFDSHSMDADPLFLNRGAGDYRLSAESPCKNVGRYGGDLGCFSNEYWLPNVGRQV